ncbi:uncharacterized protein LOC132630733 [Lycium barbarum]|uniref:uncharacterized protein LOC132630733 n=1 Tax=Lycium barbarum TaxID=112863 RepID=UPI00293F4E3B|nr:uncharacterized protein LOC132630733 [Lycium barbarum]
MRPISLSNVINKVISRVVHNRLDKILTRVISSNQSGFVKGRNIIENVLLTQEIITDIRKREKPANVVIKLDMAKAYDRVSWLYLCKVKGIMGFSLFFIDLIWRLLVNNWYSVLLNGQAHGFFHSTRGVKQGDPLSPALFIIAVEVLSRALNSLFDQSDDTIIFSSADSQSLHIIMDILQEYEKVSGQMINKRKSSFYLFSKVSQEISEQVETITGFVRGHFPFTYLGVPITHARKRKVDYTELLKKIKDRLQTWKGKLLSYGGKAVLITSVLQSGLGFRSIYDTSKALCAKLWWKFRTTSSLWDNFMWNKYCKKQIPQSWQINEQVEDVSELMTDGKWNISKLMQLFPEDIVQHIIQEIDIKYASNEWDRPWWMMTSTCKFTFKVPIDEVVASIGIPLVSKCCCCQNAQIETINHMFLCGELATKVWRYFNMGAGLSMNCVQVKQAIRSWWEAKCHFKMKTIYKAVPAFIVWEIWKWRNHRLHGGNMNLNRVLYDINMNIHMLCKLQFPGMNIPTIWHQMVQFFEGYKPTVICRIIEWRRPAPGIYKCNTDGAAKGNPGPSSSAFCIRNEKGDLVYAAAKSLADGTNIVAEAEAEAEAVRMGLRHCVVKQLFPLIIETDSMTMKMILNDEWKVPWSISMLVDDIKRMMTDHTVSVEHIHREGNGLAIFLTNFVFGFAGSIQFHNFRNNQVKLRGF